MVAHAKVAVIGAGAVGASISYALMLKDIASEILVVDVVPNIVQGQVLDLSDAACVSSTRVRVATSQEAGQADIIVVTAGAGQRDGESRVQLVDRNYKILQSVIGGMQPIRKDAIMLLVANPVDVLTRIAQKLSGLPQNQVFGSGTYLDSTRLRTMLADTLHVNPSSVHAYVLGEHGDSQFIAWNAASVAGKPLLSFPEIQKLDKEEVRRKIAGKAYEIIKLKGATYYGIGACVADLCESIILNKNQVRPLSVFVDRLGAVLSMPTKFGGNGVEEIYEIPLTKEEEEQLQASAEAMKAIVSKY
ncbi:lactate dehydrogenase B [Radiomyces spectabilis]|uniref:lactate dehydrogenase B n=1 Tax=Radiomyces spectabilis TaxID=64574 RepID=UPI0022211CEA|nr:lactate dehydrogenase B [Radiomyces spectabilis]KAI8379411.1 lactate dehydrogenase B [Radiomyces spectabilis]